MRPAGAVAVEVADQVGIVAKLGTMGPGNIVAPLAPVFAAKVVMAGVLLPLMRFGQRQQVTIRHVECLVLFVGERAGMTPLSYGHFLHPTDRVEPPAFQIWSDRFFDPTDVASAVFLTPQMDVLGVAHRCRVDMVDAEREERFSLRRDQPPMLFPFAKCEESVRLRLGRLCCRCS